MSKIDGEYAARCFNLTAQPADTLGEQDVITFDQFADIVGALAGHMAASDALLGNVEGWKPTGFLNVPGLRVASTDEGETTP
jgi:hypothetical protein